MRGALRALALALLLAVPVQAWAEALAELDPARGTGTLRFSYARSTEDIAEGLDRLARYMAGR